MPVFDKSNMKELKEFLYNSCVHDANLKNVKYEYGTDSLKIELFNPIFDLKIDFTFRNIGIVLTIKSREHSGCETIISLTAEEDSSYLQNYLPKHGENVGESLYLLFQMFSGDELHITAKEVVIEITR